MSETIEATLPDPIDVRNIPCEQIDDLESFRQDPGDLADLRPAYGNWACSSRSS
jgi:hypothetical protein